MYRSRYGWYRYPRAAVFFLLLCGLAAPARADLLDDVLGILNTAGVVDSSVVEAKPVIQCLIKGKSVEYCAEHVAKATGIKIPTGDPKIKKVVDIFHAVQSKDWIKVFHLSSEQVVCGLVPGGAVKDLFCGELFKIAKPVIEKVYYAVTKGDWWELVALLGPEIACSVIPGGAVKDAVCGSLGKALAEVGKFAVGGVNAGKDALIDVGEKLSGQEQHMPPEKYYELYWYPERHTDLLSALLGGQPSHKVDYKACVGYFDSHKASKDSAEKWCGKMEAQLAYTVKALVAAAKAAPDAYFEARVKPRLFELALDSYHQAKPSKGTEPFLGLSQTAGSELSKILPPLPKQTMKLSSPPYTAYEWMVDRVMERTFQEIALQKGFAVGPALKKFASAGCPKIPKQGKSDAVQIRCDSYDGLLECREKLDHETSKKDSHTHCLVDQGAATKKLSAKIAQELGSKRCKADGSQILCTRPYKKEKCEERLNAYRSKGVYLYNYCSLKEDPPFVSGKKLAKQILNTLNGVQKAGGTVGPGGKVDELIIVPPVQPCKTTWDPLAIACDGLSQGQINASLSSLGTKLGHCLSDPNQDGADAPCYSGPYSIQDQKAGSVQEGPVASGVLGGGGGAKEGMPSAAQKAPAGLGGLPPLAGKVQEFGSGSSGKGGTSVGGPVAAPASMQEAAPSSRGRQAAEVARLSATADIRSGPRVMIAGRYPVVWNQAVTVSDADARRRLNGVCEMTIQHDTQNAGTAASGPFARRWINRQNPVPFTDVYPSIPAGGSVSKTDTVSLRPGLNQLTLTLDHLNQVREGNDANNTYQVTVTVNGSCGASITAPSSPPGRGMPTSPPSRLLAPQQPPAAPAPNRSPADLPMRQ